MLIERAPISFPLPDTPGRPESPPDRALLVIDRNGGQTSKPGARRPLESTARDSAPSCPQSCVVEVVSSSKAPLRNRICWNQQLHRFAASFLCKERSVTSLKLLKNGKRFRVGEQHLGLATTAIAV